MFVITHLVQKPFSAEKLIYFFCNIQLEKQTFFSATAINFVEILLSLVAELVKIIYLPTQAPNALRL